MSDADYEVKQSKGYKKDYDPILGYARGVILCDDVEEYRSVRAAEEVLLHRYNEHGVEGVHNLMALVDNCRTPAFFDGLAYEERFLSSKLMEERLTQLAREHMGGDNDYRAMAFNRVTAAVTSLALALVSPGSVVPYVVPPYPGLGFHGHPCVPRAVELARARYQLISTVEELEQVFDQEPNVPLVIVCGSYRGIVLDEIISAVCRVAHNRGVPVFVDDASGARNRVISFGQSRAVDLGADLVITSADKAALFGPRAGVLLGRTDLMLKIGAKAVMMGTEARPSTIASIIQCLEEFTPERGRELFAQSGVRHRRIWEMMKPVLGESLDYDASGGVHMGVEAFTKLVMEKTGTESIDVAPVDVTTAHAMLMLRLHGFMTVTALHYPGAAKLMSIKVNALKSATLSDEDIAGGALDSLDHLTQIITDKPAIERVLFGPPE